MSYKTIPEINGLPWLGNIFEFGNNGPAFMLKAAAEHGEIVRFTMFGRPFHLISDPDLVHEVLVKKIKSFPKGVRDNRILKKMLGNGLVSNRDFSSHKKQRKIAQPAFHMRRIAGYADVMVQYTDEMLTKWQTQDEVNIKGEMAELTMFIALKTLFDTDKSQLSDDTNDIAKAIHQLQKVVNHDLKRPILLPTWVPTKYNRIYLESKKVLDHLIQTLIDARREEIVDGALVDHGDLMSMLMLTPYEDGSFMSDEQLRDELVTLFVAGHETTSNALTWSWYLLAQHPEVAQTLQAEIQSALGERLPTMHDLADLPYTKRVVQESMRLYPPAWMLNSRQATEDTQIGDYLIPKDGLIFISPYLMHRNPRFFDDPHQFNPDRWTPDFEKQLPRYAYIPFGGGARICIGNSFAMMEAQLLIATIAARYTLERVDDSEVELEPLVTMGPKGALRMRLVPHEITTPVMT